MRGLVNVSSHVGSRAEVCGLCLRVSAAVWITALHHEQPQLTPWGAGALLWTPSQQEAVISVFKLSLWRHCLRVHAPLAWNKCPSQTNRWLRHSLRDKGWKMWSASAHLICLFTLFPLQLLWLHVLYNNTLLSSAQRQSTAQLSTNCSAPVSTEHLTSCNYNIEKLLLPNVLLIQINVFRLIQQY